MGLGFTGFCRVSRVYRVLRRVEGSRLGFKGLGCIGWMWLIGFDGCGGLPFWQEVGFEKAWAAGASLITLNPKP